jgi:hypothetical protein
MKLLGSFIVSVSLFAVGLAHADSRLAAALKVLHSTNAAVTWDAKGAKVADVTCDRVADTIVVGYESKAVWLGIVPGSKSTHVGEPITIRFSVGEHTQNSFCEIPVRISIYPIDCENDEGPIPGCKVIKGCSAFSLADDACDSFHFYWDSSRKSLTWWRL